MLYSYRLELKRDRGCEKLELSFNLFLKQRLWVRIGCTVMSIFWMGWIENCRLTLHADQLADLCRAWCYRSDAPGFLPRCLHTTSRWSRGWGRFGSSAADPLHRTANRSSTPPTLSTNSSSAHSRPLHIHRLHLGTYDKRQNTAWCSRWISM